MKISIQTLEAKLTDANVPFTKVLNDTCGFFSIYYEGDTVKKSNTFFKSIKNVQDLDICKGESGHDQKNGKWQRFKFWN